jgi:hypothetical protein
MLRGVSTKVTARFVLISYVWFGVKVEKIVINTAMITCLRLNLSIVVGPAGSAFNTILILIAIGNCQSFITVCRAAVFD